MPAPVHSVPIEKAARRILQQPVVADRSLPPFDRVMMDGFAVAWSEGLSNTSEFKITSRQLAGEKPHTLQKSQPETAIEIMTGAALPLNADTVIPYEETDYMKGGKTFRIKDVKDIDPKQYIHSAGLDCTAGDILIQKGTRLGPAEIGVAASCGCAELRVNQLPRIAVIGTGDELVPINETPLPHQIRRSNAAALENALSSAGFPARTLVHFSDDAEAETSRLKEIVETHDIVVISGAVSRGTADWIAPALDALGDCIFHGVAQRPGKPMGVWKTDRDTVAFGLPGNPVSALVGHNRHVIPFLRRCAGEEPIVQRITLSKHVEVSTRLTVFLPIHIIEDGRALPRATKNSGDFAGLVGSDGFVELAADRTCWTPGETVPYYPWIK